MKNEEICKQHLNGCDVPCDGRDLGCVHRQVVCDDIDEDAIAHNEMMRERDDRNREYIEMRNMYEDGDLL